MDLFVDPVFCGGHPCQHTFCRICFTHALEQSGQCPQCRAEISQEDLVTHQALSSLLDEVRVKCRRGCGWAGRRDALPAHLVDCPVVKLIKMRACLDDRAGRILALETELVARQAELDANPLQQHLSEHDARIAKLGERVRAQESSLISLEESLIERAAYLARLERYASEQGVDVCGVSRRSLINRGSDLANPQYLQALHTSAASGDLTHRTSLEDMLAGNDLDL